MEEIHMENSTLFDLAQELEQQNGRIYETVCQWIYDHAEL